MKLGKILKGLLAGIAITVLAATSLNAQVGNPYAQEISQVFTWSVSDFDGDSADVDTLVGYIPDNAVIVGGYVDVTTDFDDGADESMEISIGLEDDIDAFMDSVAASTLNTNGFYKILPGTPTLGDDADHNTQSEVAALIGASYIKTSANKRVVVSKSSDDALDAGELYIIIKYIITK